MNRRYQYHEEEKDKEFIIDSMKKYLVEKQELDKKLEDIITPYIESKKLQIFDPTCGIGHILYFLSKISPNSSFFGIDQTPYLIEEAKKLCGKPNIKFDVDDVYDITAVSYTHLTLPTIYSV